MKKYKVVPLNTGWFTGATNGARFEEVLNQHAAQGWRFVRSVQASRRMLFVTRNSHFLVFEQDVYESAELTVLREIQQSLVNPNQ